jgi:hypothetical protein
MEEKKSCDGHRGAVIEHGEEWCCESVCFVCKDGRWVEKSER